MRFIGITGGVGAGKSTVLNYMAEKLHARILVADEIAHELMQPGTDCFSQLQEQFGQEDIFDENGAFDRAKLAKVIFSDQKKREALNAIVHPAVKQYIITEAGKERKAGTLQWLVLEAALLIEEGYDKICDELWYVYTTEDNRRKRLRESRGYTDERIDGIFKSQLPEEEYRRHTRAVIDNNGSKEETISGLEKILKERGS